MLQNYRAFLIGSDTVTGRATQIIEVRPRVYVDGARGPVRRFWIDRDSALTLRTDAFNYQKQLVMSTVLSELNFNPSVTPDTFASTDSLRKVASRGGFVAEEMGEDTADVERETGIRISTPQYLPPGFVFDGAGVHSCSDAGAGAKAALSRFSDGVNTLTIFALSAAPETKAEASASKHGSCDFGPGTMVMAQKDDLKSVAVADLPPETLHRVLDSTPVVRIAHVP
jgi:negative regulator of sigma E activity